MEDLDLRWEEVDFDCEIWTGEVDAAASVGRRQLSKLDPEHRQQFIWSETCVQHCVKHGPFVISSEREAVFITVTVVLL